MRRLLFLLPVFVFAALVAYFGSQLGEDPSLLPSTFIDKPFPEITTAPLKEAKPGLATSDLVGGVHVVNVWASWCIPCRAEHPLINRLAEEAGVPVHGLNYKDTREAAIAWLDELGDPYTRIGFDATGRVGIDLGVYGVPETYIIGPDGHIRFKRVGPITPQIMQEDIMPLIKGLQK